jgi:kynurenine formamidase
MSEHMQWIREQSVSAHQNMSVEGTLARIDAPARLRGIRAVRSGEVHSLALALVGGVNLRGDDRPIFQLERFYQQVPAGVYTDPAVGTGTDHVRLDSHGIDNTHIDALNHTAVDGVWYGGIPVDAESPGDLRALSRRGVVTRGIHLDLSAAQGRSWVSIDEPVTADCLQHALDATGLQVEPGDALLLDLGRDRFVAGGGALHEPMRPGVGESGARWIADQPVSAVAWDLLDAKHPSQTPAAVHLLNWSIGLVLIDNCDFSHARDALVANGREALLMTAPLAIAGATGGNVNPLVMV